MMANRKYCRDPLKIHKSLQKKDLRCVSFQLLQKFPSFLTKDDKLCSVCRKRLVEISVDEITLVEPQSSVSVDELKVMNRQEEDFQN